MHAKLAQLALAVLMAGAASAAPAPGYGYGNEGGSTSTPAAPSYAPTTSVAPVYSPSVPAYGDETPSYTPSVSAPASYTPSESAPASYIPSAPYGSDSIEIPKPTYGDNKPVPTGTKPAYGYPEASNSYGMPEESATLPVEQPTGSYEVPSYGTGMPVPTGYPTGYTPGHSVPPHYTGPVTTYTDVKTYTQTLTLTKTVPCAPYYDGSKTVSTTTSTVYSTGTAYQTVVVTKGCGDGKCYGVDEADVPTGYENVPAPTDNVKPTPAGGDYGHSPAPTGSMGLPVEGSPSVPAGGEGCGAPSTVYVTVTETYTPSAPVPTGAGSDNCYGADCHGSNWNGTDYSTGYGQPSGEASLPIGTGYTTPADVYPTETGSDSYPEETASDSYEAPESTDYSPEVPTYAPTDSVVAPSYTATEAAPSETPAGGNYGSYGSY